jgi:hypothetical protein
MKKRNNKCYKNALDPPPTKLKQSIDLGFPHIPTILSHG